MHKKYCIDYRNGNLGNTILSHVLYSCDQISIDLSDFFSKHGNAHYINKINTTSLTAGHMLEYPDPDLKCVLQVKSRGWFDILRFKMSYSKWMEEYPTLENFSKFFQSKIHVDSNQQWKDFYRSIKDPSWPRCDSLVDYNNLPTDIKKEIKYHWTEPSTDISSWQQLLEFLTISYYDLLLIKNKISPEVSVYYTDQYLSGNFDQLCRLANNLNWKWDHLKSQLFFAFATKANQEYLLWLEKIKTIYQVMKKERLIIPIINTWEQALLLSKLLIEEDKHPNMIKWKNTECFFDKKSIKLSIIGI